MTPTLSFSLAKTKHHCCRNYFGSKYLLPDNHLPPHQLVSALTKAGHYFGRLALEPYLLIKAASVGIILTALSALFEMHHATPS
jgi:hypothetical protein